MTCTAKYARPRRHRDRPETGSGCSNSARSVNGSARAQTQVGATMQAATRAGDAYAVTPPVRGRWLGRRMQALNVATNSAALPSTRGSHSVLPRAASSAVL